MVRKEYWLNGKIDLVFWTNGSTSRIKIIKDEAVSGSFGQH